LIPTMIVFGLVAGYWWKFALPAAAIGWSALLLVTGVISADQIPVAALLGLANAAVGVAVLQAVLLLVRRSSLRLR
jgi:hypothetical protein